jgi:ABC-type Fe3+-siderophore transport system permease subunit
MKKQIKDERIIKETRKQNNLGFTILYFGLLLALVYRQFIIKEPISDYWDLALLFFGVTFYLATKRVSSGLLTNTLNWKKIIPTSIIATVVFLIINSFNNQYRSIFEAIISGVIFLVLFYGLNLLMHYFSSKKNDDILKED